ncbi:MAG: cell division protein FtsZ [Rhodospirillaceae bacterium]|jgi:cell division protein FtsZ|nr:cell division protein FtsZ [Rhodospirillaceae bacterium]MBT5243872.1 cell division protein FtsZ [Rhodospirillaceae bacterium]MBT5562921.1 cell division protein FtsZ [Rhodospirillaceae bacterium]MBT6241320.1 cell division protein FtsZ [Rhodospirillaceae bacterium]MBT7137662.1 cell division protein FtsZ [Rhodospirillaceae bacterium]
MTSASKDSDPTDPSPRIGIIGVGGAGGNAINNMIRADLAGVNYLAANTDAQALAASLASHSLQLGAGLTSGLGSGAQVEIGRAAAEESVEDIKKWVSQCDLLFIAAGMGGGTGTGAAPVIADIARDQQALSVGVVTLPFDFEGPQRMRTATQGMIELEKLVDTLIVIPNQNLFAIANASTTFANAFVMADEVLHDAIRGITDLIVLPGLINLDFADVRSVITKTGRAMMGTGEASGEGRAINAAEAAIANPLLDIVSIKGAEGLLINVTGGTDMTLFEIDEAANRIRSEVGGDSLIIFGSAFDPALDGKLRVSVVATGLQGPQSNSRPVSPEPEPEPEPEPTPEPQPEAFAPPAIEPAMAAVMEAVMEHASEEPEQETTVAPEAEGNSDSHPIPAPTVPRPENEPAAAAPAINETESPTPEPKPEPEEVPAMTDEPSKKEKTKFGWAGRIFRS